MGYDDALTITDSVEIVAQVNGRIRAKFQAPLNTAEQKLKELALKEQNVKVHLNGKQIVKEIIVKNKLVNLVVK